MQENLHDIRLKTDLEQCGKLRELFSEIAAADSQPVGNSIPISTTPDCFYTHLSSDNVEVPAYPGISSNRACTETLAPAETTRTSSHEATRNGTMGIFCAFVLGVLVVVIGMMIWKKIPLLEGYFSASHLGNSTLSPDAERCGDDKVDYEPEELPLIVASPPKSATKPVAKRASRATVSTSAPKLDTDAPQADPLFQLI
jgi:hypothetical protein